MPLPPPVIKIVLLVSFIIKSLCPWLTSAIFRSCFREFSPANRRNRCPLGADSPRRSRNERNLSLKLLHGADPFCLLDDCVSQGPDPVFKHLCLHHHHLAVVGAERNSRHTLKGGEEVDREFSRILFMAKGPELLLKPFHGHGIERCGLLRKSAALLVQLGTQAAQRTSPTRKLLPVPMNAFHKCEQPLLRRTQPVQLPPEFPKLCQSLLHYRLAEFFLRLEVVVNIAYREMSGFGDVLQAGLSETVLIRQLHRSLHYPLPLVPLHLLHILFQLFHHIQHYLT